MPRLRRRRPWLSRASQPTPIHHRRRQAWPRSKTEIPQVRGRRRLANRAPRRRRHQTIRPRRSPTPTTRRRIAPAAVRPARSCVRTQPQRRDCSIRTTARRLARCCELGLINRSTILPRRRCRLRTWSIAQARLQLRPLRQPTTTAGAPASNPRRPAARHNPPARAAYLRLWRPTASPLASAKCASRVDFLLLIAPLTRLSRGESSVMMMPRYAVYKPRTTTECAEGFVAGSKAMIALYVLYLPILWWGTIGVSGCLGGACGVLAARNHLGIVIPLVVAFLIVGVCPTACFAIREMWKTGSLTSGLETRWTFGPRSRRDTADLAFCARCSPTSSLGSWIARTTPRVGLDRQLLQSWRLR